ncbi:MAG: hypothetical protein WAM97_01795 [Acidimicrobiales bacterium]
MIQQLWQKNGYQYTKLTVACLKAYDTQFQWLSNTAESETPGQVSVFYQDRHSVVAAQSQTGTCWYELNLMGPGDPVQARDDLPTYGVYMTYSDTNCDVDAVLPGGDWEPADPLPPEFGS